MQFYDILYNKCLYLHGKYAAFVLSSDFSDLENFSIAPLSQNLTQFKILWSSFLLSRIDSLLRQLDTLKIIRPKGRKKKKSFLKGAIKQCQAEMLIGKVSWKKFNYTFTI